MVTSFVFWLSTFPKLSKSLAWSVNNDSTSVETQGLRKQHVMAGDTA